MSTMIAVLTFALWLAQEVVADVPEVVKDPAENGLLVVLAGAVIPLLTAVVTRWNASSTLKGFTTLVLSFVAGAVAQLLDGSAVWSQDFVVNSVIAFVTAVVAYDALWKGKVAPAIRRAIPGGIGGDSGVPPGA